MKHWRILYPGGEGEDCHVVPDNAEQMCIDDWVVTHWAIEETVNEQ